MAVVTRAQKAAQKAEAKRMCSMSYKHKVERAARVKARRGPKKSTIPSKTAAERRLDHIKMHGKRNVDIWIGAALAASKPWYEAEEPLVDGFKVQQLLVEDKVKVNMTVTEVKHVDQESPFVDESTWSLVVQIIVPRACGFLLPLSKSPCFILDSWYGFPTARESPIWVEFRTTPAPVIWMPRIEALEVVRIASLASWNTSKVDELVNWCTLLTTYSPLSTSLQRGSTADLKKQRLVPSTPIPEPPTPPKPKVVTGIVTNPMQIFRAHHNRRQSLKDGKAAAGKENREPKVETPSRPRRQVKAEPAPTPTLPLAPKARALVPVRHAHLKMQQAPRCQDSDGPFGSTSAPSERVIWAQLGYKLMLIQEDVIGDLQMSEDYFSFGD
ncbi:hypothetical protein DFP72DRAFT_844406 [Ephemerocybe angulata]|uniref:Uncharacterized protein n=1 Tax=Ephemerocybe angulata TaxID=980116 RepID=A0A8H6M8R1_9AGAR|nr:hypothetical protein DFP72DRAFT_844406 [Tulosesus angulatus]